MSKNKAKGTAAETAVVEYFKHYYPEAKPMRVPLAGSRDMGDVILFHGTDYPVIIEVKAAATYDIPAWLRELGRELHNYQQYYELEKLPEGFLFVKPKGVGVDNVECYWAIQYVGEVFNGR